MAPERKGVAIVTGSANGMGTDIALRLADDGYDLALFDLPRAAANLESVAEKIRQKGRKAAAVPGDVSVEKDVERLIQTAVNQLGSVDVMVANAGILLMSPFLEAKPQDFEKTFAVNARGPFLCLLHAARQMIKQGRGGRIIAASSLGGINGEPEAAFYCASKFAIRGLVQSFAKELGSHGITVNAYAPGPIATTALYAEARDKYAKALGFADPYEIDELEKRNIPVGYLGRGEDIANVVSFLAKKESHFMTGQTISANGGRYVF